MIIDFITLLGGKKFAGLTYSVPAQVKAQSKIDDVYWINFGPGNHQHWIATEVFHKGKDYNHFSIKSLPKPYDHPDLVVFESFYHMGDCLVAKELKKIGIPYIIVPRSALTDGAQHKKRIKKIIGNALFFKRYAKNALAIHYLTNKEYEDSGDSWNAHHFIIPNGIEQHNRNTYESVTPKKWSFIARYEIYQKGIDLLLRAIACNKERLIESNIQLNMYGDGPEDIVDSIKKQIDQDGIGDIVKVNAAAYDKEKEKILMDTDLFVLTSRFEGHPMGLIEALSYGIPCLISAGTNMKEEVEAAGAGWTCEGDSESISKAIQMILDNNTPLDVYSWNAAKLSNQYAWESIAEMAHKKYSELLKK